MEEWAHAQGIEPVTVITDEDHSSVKLSAIKESIEELIALQSVEQLIVFFAGHGINVNRTERWLLSGAPDDPQEAVNVDGSAEFARYGAIPHVVMISDACRTAAHNLQMHGVNGGEIFPNKQVVKLEIPVDKFFACTLGNPAHEIGDGKAYKAIYTRALLTALQDGSSGAADGQGYVRPRPLKKYLRHEVPRRLRARRMHTKVIQEPDARIESDEQAWISQVSTSGPSIGIPIPSLGTGFGTQVELPVPLARLVNLLRRLGTGFPPRPFTHQEIPSDVLGLMLDPILTGRIDEFDEFVRDAQDSDEPRIVDIATSIATTASPFGETRFETKCGFKVRGARVLSVVGGRMLAEQLADDLVRIRPTAERRSGNVLLVLDRGQGIALPAILGFLTAVTVEHGEVIDVTYEPSENTDRWLRFNERAGEIRALRAIAAANARLHARRPRDRPL